MKKEFQKEKGISLVEILVAIGLVGIVSASMSQFLSTITIISREGERRVIALGLAQEGIAAARSVRDRDYNTLKSYTSNKYNHPVIQSDQWIFQDGTEKIDDFYYRRVEIKEVCRYYSSGEIDNDDIDTQPDDDINCGEADVYKDDDTLRIVSSVYWPVPPEDEPHWGYCWGGIEYSGGCLGPPSESWPKEATLVTYLANWK